MEERRKYFRWGLTAFIVICGVLVFYDAFYQEGTLQNLFDKIFYVFSPIIVGLVMAYLLAPVEQWCEKGVLWLLEKVKKKKKITKGKWLRVVGITLTWILVIFLFYIIFSMIIPNLVDSIALLVRNARYYYNEMYSWAENFIDQNKYLQEWGEENLQELYATGKEILTSKVIPWAQKMIENMTDGLVSGVVGVVNFVKNLIVAIIVSIYLLAMREGSIARTCKLIYATFKEKTAVLLMHGIRRVNSIFSGFVRGNLLDSAIIGVLCLIFCEITRMPYAPLVSIIIGVTNIIPFFGPIFGTIPAAFLILLVSPKKCLFFLIFILVLQQLDGNVIKPVILGDTTGISGLWVIVGIIVGGGFAGVLGMLLGVPTVACIRIFVIWIANRRLEKKNMPIEAYHYVSWDLEKEKKE